MTAVKVNAREWVEEIVSRGDNIYSVFVRFADYDPGSCRTDDPRVSRKVYADLGEPKTVPEQSEGMIYDSDDRTHLSRAVSLGKYIGD